MSALADEPVLDVVVVGAGAAGVGMGIVLRHLGVERFALVDRHEVGASFARWPEGTRFISPSFSGHGFGAMDLNSVAIGTSPGWSLQREHPTGPEYQAYLQQLVGHFRLPVATGIDVQGLAAAGAGPHEVVTDRGPIRAHNVVWATGELQYPAQPSFPGASLGVHTADLDLTSSVAGAEVVIVGGGESGVDAAVHLAARGAAVTVVEQSDLWESDESDPSLVLSPFSRERLDRTLDHHELTLLGGVRVREVSRLGDGYEVRTDDGPLKSDLSPVLATGFRGGAHLVHDHFEWHDGGWPLLTGQDESTATPGLFLVGPQVRHEDVIFCFIFKFRQRFAIVAEAIVQRLAHVELDTAVMDAYRAQQMYLDDLSGCCDQCEC